MASNKKTLEINKQGVSRRQLLGLTTAGIVSGMAGCFSGEGDDDDGNGNGGNGNGGNGNGGNGGNGDGEPLETTVDVMAGTTPEEVNMNRFALNPGYHWIVREWTGIHTNAMEEADWVVFDGEGTYYDDETYTNHYKVKEDEYYWANGDPITGEDLFNEMRISLLRQPEEQRWTNDIELINEWEYKAVTEDPSNPLLLQPQANRIAYNKGREEAWLEQLLDASDQDERDEISVEMQETRITMQEFIDEGMSSSIWHPVDFDETKVVFEKSEDHPYADELDYDELIAHTCDGASCDQMIEHDEIDIGTGRFPEQLRDVSPDHLQTISESRALASRNLHFRYDNDHTGNRWVRRALLTSLDLTRLVDLFQGEGGFVKQNQSGMDQGMESRYFDQDFIDSLYHYPLEADEELAAEFMEEGGYERDDDTWVDEDGEEVEFDFVSPSGSMYFEVAEAINDSWQAFGLTPSLSTMDFGTMIPHLRDGTGEIDVSLFSTGWGRGTPNDYFAPDNHFMLHLYTRGTDDIQGWLDEGLTHSQNNGRPIVLEIPEEPGDIFMENGSKEVNLFEMWEEFLVTLDEEEAIEIIRDFVIYFNYDLPRPDLFPQINGLWGNTRDWEFPDDHPYYHETPENAQHLVHRFGVMQGRTQ